MLCESIVVTEYLADEFGAGTIQPATPSDRAKARLFTELCSGAFSYFPILRARGDAAKTDEAKAAFASALVGVEAFLEASAKRRGSGDGMDSSSGPFLLGETFSTAECIAAPFVQRCCTVLPHFCGPELDPFLLCDQLRLPRLSKWMSAVLARQSVVTSGVPSQGMIESTSKMLERFAAAEAAQGAK